MLHDVNLKVTLCLAINGCVMKKSLILFLVLTFGLAACFFLFPINLFDGVIEYEEPFRSYKVETRLSLSYFIGIGYEPEHMTNVRDFYLTTKGVIMAVIFILGVPALVGYRVYLSSKKEKR